VTAKSSRVFISLIFVSPVAKLYKTGSRLTCCGT